MERGIPQTIYPLSLNLSAMQNERKDEFMKTNKKYTAPQFSVMLVSTRDVIAVSVYGDDNVEIDIFEE